MDTISDVVITRRSRVRNYNFGKVAASDRSQQGKSDKAGAGEEAAAAGVAPKASLSSGSTTCAGVDIRLQHGGCGTGMIAADGCLCHPGGQWRGSASREAADGPPSDLDFVRRLAEASL